MLKIHAIISCAMLLASQLAIAQSAEDIAFKLNFSVVKVQISNEKGDRGIGSGVVVSPGQGGNELSCSG